MHSNVGRGWGCGRNWRGKNTWKWVWRVKGSSSSKEEILTETVASLQLDYSWKLPEEITSQILSRLPVKSVMRCHCVCKAWRSFIKDPHFVSMHLTRTYKEKEQSLLLDTIRARRDDEDRGGVPLIHMLYDVYLIENMLGLGRVEQPYVRLEVPDFVWASCNGLLLTCSLNSKVFKICNPFTQETVQLPTLNIGSGNKICGFGYHPMSKEYKVLCFPVVSRRKKKSCKFLAEVHTLGSNLWRSKGEIPFAVYWQTYNVLVNGALHWLVEYPRDSENLMITAFDIGDEEFRFFQFPPKVFSNDKLGHIQVQEFGEFLSLVDFSSPNRVEIWVMKHYGVEESWAKQFVVPIAEQVSSITLIWPLEGGKVLLQYNQKFVSYDPKHNQITYLAVQAPPRIRHTYVHVGSLVSPHMTMRQLAESGPKSRAA